MTANEEPLEAETLTCVRGYSTESEDASYYTNKKLPSVIQERALAALQIELIISY
jgi:hypothetical protein